MWLLSTNRAELLVFPNAHKVEGGYAILSHTWDGNEQTLQEVLAIGERCKKSMTNPREDPELSEKIRRCCMLAEDHGFRWLWIDSCCIDKTSSSELSEAINSMYEWYAQSEICYAYLADVPGHCIPHTPSSKFRSSRWHKRGWTLQELIAPAFLIFLSADWCELGNRTDLAALLEEVTRVDTKILKKTSTLARFSVSTRMCWASTRETTRVEDEAYCLMGLFGVSMPTNYGEGKKAFARLQYEIMRHNPDTSLFAFGFRIGCDGLKAQGLTLYPKDRLDNPTRYLLAPTPRKLTKACSYTPDLGTNAMQSYPPPLLEGRNGAFATSGPFGVVECPQVTVTSYGAKLRLPVFESDGVTVAVLLCEDGDSHLGLLLHRDYEGKDPTRPRYYAGCAYATASSSIRQVARMAKLGGNLFELRFNGKRVEATWRTIFAVPTSLDWGPRGMTIGNLTINCDPAPPFRFPHWLVSRFAALQFEVYQVEALESHTMIRIFHRRQKHLYLLFGICRRRSRAHWARIVISRSRPPATHDCSNDHIESWNARTKDFHGSSGEVARLSFTPCRRQPETTLVIHIELLGHQYEEMLREAHVSLPLQSNPHSAAVSSALPSSHIESSSLRPPSQLQPVSSTRSSYIPSAALRRFWNTG